MLYGSYLGGSSSDFGYGMAVQSPGHIYLTGYTYSTNFAPGQGHHGGADVFFSRISLDAAVENSAASTKYYRANGQLVAFRRESGYGEAYGLRYVFGDHPSTSLRTSFKPFGGYHYTWSKWADGATLTNRQTDYRFTGQRQESEIKLYDYVSRWYDYRRGRFVQPDTIVPNPGNPSDFNRYVYTRNNPIGFNDPTGHRLEEGAGYQMCGGIGCIYPEDHPLAGYLIGTTEEDVAQAQAQMQAAGEVVIGILLEPADWAVTFNYWRQGEFHWTDLAGLLPIIPASGVRALRHADVISQITNAIPRTRRYARAIPNWVAELIESGERGISLAPPSETDAFITAAEDLARYRSQASVAKRLTLPPGNRAIVTFKYHGPIASPVLRENPGFLPGGLTAGGAREWVIPNQPLDALNVSDVTVRYLE